jgi:hypothetical protein
MDRPQRFKYVDFDLPFLLFLKDSLGDNTLKEWADAYIAGKSDLPYSPYAPPATKPGHFIIGGGLPVYIPPEPLAQWYLVRLPHLEVGIRLLRRVNPHRATVMMGEVPGDRTGRASFSSVRVMFDITTILPEHHSNFPLFCQIAIEAINHFIAHYRVVADRPYIDAVTMSMIQSFVVTTKFENGEQIQQQYGTGSGALHGMGGSVSDEVDAALRSAVSKPEPPKIDLTLDANIRNYLDLQNWRMAVMETALSFEAWVSRLLRERLQTLGELDIEKRFLDSRGRPRSITSIVQKVVHEVLGYDFGGTPEYAAWEKDVRDLRNDVVHGKVFDVSREQAMTAYASAKAAAAAIKLNTTPSSSSLG